MVRSVFILHYEALSEVAVDRVGLKKSGIAQK
jgi:hypothetical protein